MPKKVFIIAGESSGDFHSASLISALKGLKPDIEISGIGGPRMRQAGAKIFFDLTELAIIGFTDVLKNWRKLKQAFKTLLAKIEAERPDAVILVDYPGFNLKAAGEIKKRNIPVIYYISPQVWAWWPGRIKTIKRCVDKMIVVFKFEEELYKSHGIDASFVGHPLLDIARPQCLREDFLHQLGLSGQRLTIGLMPGSRKMEVARILPILLESAQLIRQKLPQVQFVLLQAPSLSAALYTEQTEKDDLGVRLCAASSYDFLQACDFVLVASGTATLESAIMQRPMIVVYKVSLLNWLIARPLVRLPYIGLVNVVAGKKLVPEFIQFQARPPLIAQCALDLLGRPQTLTDVKQGLEKVRQGLGRPGASQRAAEIILGILA